MAPLVDHHCHGVRRDAPSPEGFELMISESGAPAPPGTTHFDTPVGAAIRRWCAPVLGLDPHPSPDAYVARRAELGAAEVNRLLLRAAGAAVFLVDTGIGAGFLTPPEMGAAGAAGFGEIVRLEQVEREVALTGGSAAGYVPALHAALLSRTAGAAAMKTIIAYRHGLDFDPARPYRGEV